MNETSKILLNMSSMCSVKHTGKHQHVEQLLQAYGKTRNSGISDENFERVTRSKIAKWVCSSS